MGSDKVNCNCSKECLIGLFAALSIVYAGILPIFSGINWNETTLISGLASEYIIIFYLMILITAAIAFGVINGKKVAYYAGIVYFALSAAFFVIAASVMSTSAVITPATEAIISIVNIAALWLLIKKK